jgi:hypothetical protein
MWHALIILGGITLTGWALHLFTRHRETQLAFSPEAIDPASELVRHWLFVRWHGGGNIHAPKAMTEEEAMRFCADTCGTVQFVDREHAFIFYRPQGQ